MSLIIISKSFPFQKSASFKNTIYRKIGNKLDISSLSAKNTIYWKKWKSTGYQILILAAHPMKISCSGKVYIDWISTVGPLFILKLIEPKPPVMMREDDQHNNTLSWRVFGFFNVWVVLIFTRLDVWAKKCYY